MLYHSARGSVGYSIVGAPTIINNVVSDFSGRNYIQSASTFPGSTATSLEFATKFNISSFASASTIVSSTSSTIPFHLAIIDSKFKFYPGRESIYKMGNFVLSANTDYWIKLFWDSTTGWKLQYSTDGINYITDFENYNPSNSAPKDNYIVIGRNYPNGGQEGLLGTLNLNNTYITVNGQPWFGIFPVEVKKHQVMGPVGYTVVGSPTIVDGVASDFSSSNVLRINNFDPSKPFVISTKIRFTATGERQYFVGVNTAGKIRILIFTDQKLLCNLGGASGFNIGEIKSTQELSTNTDYFVKLEFTGSKYILSLSEDNVVYSIIGEIVSSAYINGGNTFNLQLGSGNLPTTGFYFRGSIDLNSTYIKVNGKLWFWQPQATKYIQRNNQLVWADPKLYLTGPVNYTVVGSPTITDGIASGFSNSDYVTVPYFLPFSKNSFEYVIKFKIGISNSGTNGTIFSFPYRKDGSQGAAYGIYKYSNALTAYCGYNANGDNITLSIPFTANSDMWVKWSFANGILKLTYSTDGINWNVGVNNEGGTEILDGTAQDISLGRISSWPGFSVDLNHTYIKVNGKLWFYGKNYATQNIAPVPAGYTYNTTTTTSIGYVDMRTQQFTPAPEGATIGRDE